MIVFFRLDNFYPLLFPMRHALRLLLLATLVWHPVVQAQDAQPALNIQQETEALMNEGLRLFGEGKYAEALAKIEQVKKNVSGKPFPQVLFVEGASYFNQNEYEKAVVPLEEYVKNFSDGDFINPVRMALGRCYINKGEPDKG
ncbi:MAG TPA: hypothetical protein DIT13_09410, partial [Verrucomicrobiales bacterium]|nr:hypothetical protein [Verrucomicrobiales bacterium]